MLYPFPGDTSDAEVTAVAESKAIANEAKHLAIASPPSELNPVGSASSIHYSLSSVRAALSAHIGTLTHILAASP
jgi:hypothetical protein